MSVQEIKSAFAQLSKLELSESMTWLESHCHEVWDKQIESALDSGRLDALLVEVEDEHKNRG